ncbi:MAG TPA: glycosyltransferase, partial [Candidatus Atribacteria bacterium]|nr:glycosyltransferase [Candidatus Atribacteria bacterium]
MRICFVGNPSLTFVKRDHEILKKHFEIDIIQPPKKMAEWVKYPLMVKKKVKNCDVVFGWFAGWHTMPAVHYARKYGKKSIVVVGGYDAAYVPEINYGAFTNMKERIPAKYIYNHVDKVLVVDPSLKRDIIKNAKVKGDNIDYLPTGYDPNHWKPEGKKEDIVLTVASANNLKRVKLKGLETFVKAAQYLPDAKFILIGVEGEAKKYLQDISSDNLEIIGFLSQKDLLPYYQKAKVYCQLSLREGLPNTLCEAMSCGCIPVGSNI